MSLEERILRCDDWDDTVPHYGDPFVLVTRFSALLHVGSKVSITGNYDNFSSITDDRTNLFYGRIINIVNNDDTIITIKW